MSTPESELDFDSSGDTDISNDIDDLNGDDVGQSLADEMQAIAAELQEQGSAPEPTPEPSVPEPQEVAAEPEPVSEAANSWEFGELGRELGVESERDAANQFVQAVVTLRQQPTEGIATLADNYIQDKSQAQDLIAHIAAKHGIDVFDVDVDAYQEQAPLRQAQATQSAYEARMLQMEMQIAQQSGQTPLLTDPTVIQGIQSYRKFKPGASIIEAYNVAVHGNPDLSAKHQQAVSANQPKPEEKPVKRTRRATPADLPKGRPGSAPRLKNSEPIRVDEEMKEIAAEMGLEL